MMMINSQQQQQGQAGQQQRQLVFVVEGTSALGPTWPLLVSEYVEKIVRSFCGFNSTGQKHNLTNGEMVSLIVYDSHDSQNGCLLQQSGWTSNIDVFFRWLSSISFSGGGYGDAAVAEGLSAALQMCCPGPNIVPAPQGRDYQKHCVLIGASNPHKIPTPVHSPPVPNYIQSPSSNGDLQSEQWWLADADMIAQAFPLCSVSLSVLAPRQLPLLRTVFSQARRGGQTAEVVPEPPKQYSQHLLLISDAFLEARMVFHRTLATSNNISNVTAKIEHQPVAVPVATVPGQLPIVGARPIPSVAATGNGALAGRPGPSLPTQPITVKTEAVTAGSLSSLLHNTNNPLPLPMQQLASPGPVSGQDAVQSPFNMTSPDPAQDFKVLGNLPASQPLRPGGASTLPSNSMLAHSPSQSRHTIGSPSLPPAGSPLSGLPSGVGVPVAPTVSTGGANSLSGVTQSTLGVSGQQGGGMGPSGLGVGQGVGLGNVHSTYNSATTSLGNNTMMGPSQSLSGNNIGNTNNGQGTITGSVKQVGFSSANQMGQTGQGLSGQNILGGVGNAVGNAGTGTMMPSSGIPQSPGQPQAHGVTNTAGASHMQHPSPLESGGTQQTTNNSLKYTRLWEGILAGQRKGNVVPIPICKLEGYRQTSSPETLAADWPPTMQIMRLIPQEYMNQNREYHRKAELLVFRPLTQHDFLVQLAEKKLCAVIQLPSQTLLLASTDKPGRMIGMLFPGEMVQIKPQVSSQQVTASAPAASQSGLTNNFSQNQLQGQVQNQLQGQVQNQLQGQVQNQLQGQVQNQLTNSQLPNQLTNQQPRSQLLPGSTTLHGAGFLP